MATRNNCKANYDYLQRYTLPFVMVPSAFFSEHALLEWIGFHETNPVGI